MARCFSEPLPFFRSRITCFPDETLAFGPCQEWFSTNSRNGPCDGCVMVVKPGADLPEDTLYEHAFICF